MRGLARWLVPLCLLASGCAADQRDAVSNATVTTVTTVTPQVPAPPPWQASPREPDPDVKRQAAAAVQAIGTYGAGEGTPVAARARLAAAGFSPSLVDGATMLLKADAASGATVRYPQFGGLTPTEASVMVITTLETLDRQGRRASETRVLDVRLARAGTYWTPTAIVADGRRPASGPQPSDGSSPILSNPRIELPDSARDDIRSRQTDPRVIDLLARLADQWPVGVTVLATGHPPNVFATDRVSNHKAGRGVDIWSVDGVAVVDQQHSPVLRALVAEALAFGATEVGAPFDTDGPGGRVFTNTLHLDHLHLAFKV